MSSNKFNLSEAMKMTETFDNTPAKIMWRHSPSPSKEYLMRLEQCKLQPAYHIQLPGGDLYPCVCEPLMEDDTKGWQVVQRRRYVKKVRTHQDLDEEADMSNWEDVEHYGNATYVNTSSYEHNGALFDIGSRF